MKIEKININKIKKNPNNPRILKDNKFKKLVKSIQDFPEMLEIRPIVIDNDFMVLWWNMRLQACKEAWLKEIFIIKADNLTEEQKKEFIIKDNVSFWEWDFDILANEWDENLLNEWWMDVDFSIIEEKEEKDLQIKTEYQILINCENEIEQEEVFEKIQNLGLNIKIKII